MMCNLYHPCYYIVTLVGLVLIAVGIVPIFYRNELDSNVPGGAPLRPIYGGDVTPLMLVTTGVLLIVAGVLLILQSLVRFWILHPTTSCCPATAEKANQEMMWMLYGKACCDVQRRRRRPSLLYAAGPPGGGFMKPGTDLRTHPLRKGIKFYRAPEEPAAGACPAAPPPPAAGEAGERGQRAIPPLPTSAVKVCPPAVRHERPAASPPVTPATGGVARGGAGAGAGAGAAGCADCMRPPLLPPAAAAAAKAGGERCCNPPPSPARATRGGPGEVALRQGAEERPPPLYTHPVKPTVFYKVPSKTHARNMKRSHAKKKGRQATSTRTVVQ